MLERVGGGPQYEWQKVHLVLQRPGDTDSQAAEEFAHLSPSDRQAILEILKDTKPDLAALLTTP